MPLEDLLSMEVTSVSKKKQHLNEVASAVYVITQEDIRRSGVTSIADALRMAPGIQVSRIDANKWVVSSRGFASQFTNMLLVMIDGRTVYDPSFSGVFWDMQDTMLADIERIEVIRGPGATIWGANAVNGVINIITKHAADTQGGLLVAGAGNEEKALMSLRYGVELGDRAFGRAYLKYNDRDSFYSPDLDTEAGDDWRSLRGGFRVDGTALAADSWTLQGDIYHNDGNQRVNIWKDPSDPENGIYAPFYLDPYVDSTYDSSGWNLMGRWNHQVSETASATLQVYYDHTQRDEAIIAMSHDTLDLDFNYRFRPLASHEVILGLGYRNISDDFDNTFMVQFIPDHASRSLYSAYIQDEIELLPRTLNLTLGSKFEHNDYTGMEIQPSARLLWLPDDRSTLWGAVSRAVRTPSRMEAGSSIISAIVPVPPTFDPAVIRVHGSDRYRSEDVIAYELGYRLQARDNLSMDLALFYNDYDNLQTFEASDPSNPLSSTVFGNGNNAHSYGAELSLEWRPLEWWRLQPNYSYLKVEGWLDADSTDRTGSEVVIDAASPRHQVSVRSMMDLPHNLFFDAWVYYMSPLEETNYFGHEGVDGFTSVNLRLAWRPSDRVELSVTGQNLLDARHTEFIGENLYNETQVERSIYGRVRWDF
ncbi:MAG TPA: TonB-dependent receptor [Sedimenticola thiotaurini]|uniref:TonB-dependent receptor n=1 Tax=Sedimenticola thiotaurini TaxID=1543721 RepID=A0A831RL99_9GAMM|nr:TonB-dependent receptor [Sedimenticola thiotaurini]